MNAGLWALSGVVAGALSTGLFNVLLQRRQFAHENEMFLLRDRSAENVKALLTGMLGHDRWVERSLEAIRKAVGGYADDEARQFLHEVGAKRATRKEGTEEWWYLASREAERIEKLRARG